MHPTRQHPVRVSLPADPAFVRLVRLLCSSLAADLDLDVDRIDDVRIAADELMNAVIDLAAPLAVVEVVLLIDDGALVLEASTMLSNGPIAMDPLSERVLAELTTSFAITDRGGEVHAGLRMASTGATSGAG